MDGLRRIKCSTITSGVRLLPGAPFTYPATSINAPKATKTETFNRIAAYRKFHEDGERDAGLIILGAHAIMWRIEYRSLELEGRSEDPSDPEDGAAVDNRAGRLSARETIG
jgi:hypothetical protein